MNIKALDGQKVEELSMIEVAYAILDQKSEEMAFSDLLKATQSYLGKSDQEIEAVLARFYSSLNTDGSFIPLGDNKWGLRSWYALDSVDEETISLEYFDDDEAVNEIIKDNEPDSTLIVDREEEGVTSGKVKIEEIVYDEDKDDEVVDLGAYDEELAEVDIDAEIPEDVVVDDEDEDEDPDETEEK